jgi:hypothetical protein
MEKHFFEQIEQMLGGAAKAEPKQHRMIFHRLT